MFRGAATSLGYKTVDDTFLIYMVPLFGSALAIAATTTVISLAGERFGALLFPVVAATAHRICVRSGVITAIICALGYNFFCVPPVHEFSAPAFREIVFYGCLVVTALVVAPKSSGDIHERRIHDRSADLPFTRNRSTDNGDSTTHKNRVFWDVKPTGDWACDCQTGEEYARLFMERVAAREPKPALCWIIGDMVAAGRFGATEIGFIQGLAKAYGPRKPPWYATTP